MLSLRECRLVGRGPEGRLVRASRLHTGAAYVRDHKTATYDCRDPPKRTRNKQASQQSKQSKQSKRAKPAKQASKASKQTKQQSVAKRQLGGDHPAGDTGQEKQPQHGQVLRAQRRELGERRLQPRRRRQE